MKWIENGERNDIFGIRKIQRQQENNIISQRWKWINTHNKNEIMDMQVKFYKNLYKD